MPLQMRQHELAVTALTQAGTLAGNSRSVEGTRARRATAPCDHQCHHHDQIVRSSPSRHEPSRPPAGRHLSLPFRLVRRIQLFTEHHAGVAGHDTGISHALVKEVGQGRHPETLRLHRTGDIVAFGKHDTITRGYPEAVAASIGHGFTPIERLAGGRAAVFHSGTLAFGWAIPADDPRQGVTARFTEIADLLTAALRSIGVDAQVGEIPGEYCPGAYSIHVDHRVKLVGVGQRLVRGAAHVGGVISVSDGRRIREVLEPVYRALDLNWLPSTAGAADEFVGDITVDAVRSAVVDAFATRYDIVPASVPEDLLRMGLELAPSHISPR